MALSSPEKLNVALAILLAIAVVLIILLTSDAPAAAFPPEHIDWLTTFEVTPGVDVAVWSLVDSTTVWPSAITGRMRRAVEAGHFQDIVYQYEHKGDYVRVVVYVEDGARWAPTADTRVVFCYGDEEVASIELIFMSFDEATRDAARTVLSSRRGVVIDPAHTGLARSGDGGFRGYVRFPPGSLPRPVRTWFGLVGGNRWGLVRPDRALAQEGGIPDAVHPDPPGRLPSDGRADSGLDHAGR